MQSKKKRWDEDGRAPFQLFHIKDVFTVEPYLKVPLEEAIKPGGGPSLPWDFNRPVISSFVLLTRFAV